MGGGGSINAHANWQAHVVNERSVHPKAESRVLRVTPFQSVRPSRQWERKARPINFSGPPLLLDPVHIETEEVPVRFRTDFEIEGSGAATEVRGEHQGTGLTVVDGPRPGRVSAGQHGLGL